MGAFTKMVVSPHGAHIACFNNEVAARRLLSFSFIVPAWMVCTMSGWQGLKGVWPAVLVCGGSFAAVQCYTANYMGSGLVDVAAGLASLVSRTLFVRVWKRRDGWLFEY